MPAKSVAQRRFMGMVRATQKGEMKNASPEVRDAAKDMSVKAVREFAKTKEKNLPMKKEEVEHLEEMPYQVYGSPDGKKEKKIGKPVKSKKYADARAAELADTHKKTGGKYRSEYTEETINERGDFWHPDPEKDRKLGGPGPNQRAREDRGASSGTRGTSSNDKKLRPGESYMQYAKRMKTRKEEVEQLDELAPVIGGLAAGAARVAAVAGRGALAVAKNPIARRAAVGAVKNLADKKKEAQQAKSTAMSNEEFIPEDAPTMSAGDGGFSGSADANGPTAGFDPPMTGLTTKKPRKFCTKKKYQSKRC